MNVKTFFALLLLVVIGCGCGKTERGSSKISVIENGELNNYLKERIPNEGEKSEIFKDIDEDFVRVINSQKEFDEVFSNIKLSEAIDFSKNSFIIGQRQMPNRFYSLKEQFMEKENDDYRLILKVFLPENHYPAFSWFYYWGIYPKVTKEKLIVQFVN